MNIPDKRSDLQHGKDQRERHALHNHRVVDCGEQSEKVGQRERQSGRIRQMLHVVLDAPQQ